MVQGYKVTDPEALADLRDLADDETVVEIPEQLLRFATQEQQA
ncbi:hypothetical protein ACFVWN_18605 [Nocardiopsis flavescens]